MRLLILMLITAIALSACGGGESAEPTATQVATQAPAAPPTDIPPAQPTELPAQPTEPPARPTEAPLASTDTPAATATTPPEPTPPPVATATDTPEPTLAPAPAAEGRVSFRDNLAMADQLVLTMRGVAPPPDGFVYEGWLIANDGVTEISSGVFEVGTDGSVDYAWTSPTGENLIAKYASFAVTVEPADDSDPGPSNEVAFRGAAAPDTLVAARRVFAVNDGEPATPRNTSYGQGVLTQSQVAKDHSLNAFNAAAIGAYAEMRLHCEHVINSIEGTAGPRFADYNDDGRAENPGDGFGALAYARQVAALLPGVSDDLSAVEDLLVAIQDKAEEILAAPDIAAAQPALDEFKAMGEQLLSDAAPTFYAAAQAAVSYPITPTP
jgi:hypothetical protein